MRQAALLGVYDLARQDERVVFIGSDITKQNLEPFAAEYPDRFFMEGIYEAHIIGMSAGLALCGKIPYVNTIATFLTRRCYEQVVVDLCLHNLPVRLLGSGGGTVYAPLGPTHLATDDLAIMRTIPNMTVLAPCDADEMRRLLPATLEWPGPIYVRIAKGGDPIVSSDENGFEIGRAIAMREGHDVLLVSTGITTQIAVAAADALAADGISATVLHVHTIKPLDAGRVLSYASSARAVVTVEEHTRVGGLGSAVVEALVDGGCVNVPVARLALPDAFADELGSQAEIMAHHGLTAAGVADRARALLDSPARMAWARS